MNKEFAKDILIAWMISIGLPCLVILSSCDSQKPVQQKKITYTVKHYHANDPVDVYTSDRVHGGGHYVLIYKEDGSSIEVHGDYVIIENRE